MHKILIRILTAFFIFLIISSSAFSRELTSYDFSNIAAEQLKKGQVILAKRNYDKAIQLNPQNSDAYIGLGNIFYQLDLLLPAEIQYKKAININPKNSEYHMLLGKVYFAEGLISIAETKFNKASELNEYDENPYIAIANCHMAKNFNNLAEKDYIVANKLNSKNSDLLASLGSRYAKKNDYAKAKIMYSKAIMANAEPSYLAGLGLILANTGSIKDAKRYFKEAFEKDKNFNNSYFNLINAKGWNDLYSNTIKDTKKLLETDPNNIDYLILLGYLYYGEKSYDDAIKIFEQILAIDSSNSCAKRLLGYIYYKKAMKDFFCSKFTDAEEKFKKAISYDSNMAESYQYLGFLYNYNHKYDLAKKYLIQAIENNPDLELAYAVLGNIYMRENKYELAAANFERFIKYNPCWEDVYFLLGSAYLKTNNYDQAKLYLEKAVEMKPDFPQAYIALLSLPKVHNQISIKKQVADNFAYGPELTEVPPEKLYKMVKFQSKKDQNITANTYKMIDLIWNDKEGKKLLNIVLKNKIPIYIVKGSSISRVESSTIGLQVGSSSPIRSGMNHTIYYGRDISIYIDEDTINHISDSSEDLEDKMISITTFVHELCHATKNSLYDDPNSISEELSASMIGYNVASRILKGRELTKEEVKHYSKILLLSALSDNHKTLPIYGNFNREISLQGINPPMLYIYQDIINLHSTIQKELNIKIPKLPDKIQSFRYDSIIFGN